MIKAQYTLISEIQRTGVLGKNDFLGVFDRIYAPGVPAMDPYMTITIALYARMPSARPLRERGQGLRTGSSRAIPVKIPA